MKKQFISVYVRSGLDWHDIYESFANLHDNDDLSVNDVKHSIINDIDRGYGGGIHTYKDENIKVLESKNENKLDEAVVSEEKTFNPNVEKLKRLEEVRQACTEMQTLGNSLLEEDELLDEKDKPVCDVYGKNFSVLGYCGNLLCAFANANRVNGNFGDISCDDAKIIMKMFRALQSKESITTTDIVKLDMIGIAWGGGIYSYNGEVLNNENIKFIKEMDELSTNLMKDNGVPMIKEVADGKDYSLKHFCGTLINCSVWDVYSSEYDNGILDSNIKNEIKPILDIVHKIDANQPITDVDINFLNQIDFSYGGGIQKYNGVIFGDLNLHGSSTTSKSNTVTLDITKLKKLEEALKVLKETTDEVQKIVGTEKASGER